ncbi:hypothetical protein ACFL6S_18285 [Candidatus Poribacteria bacterium]
MDIQTLKDKIESLDPKTHKALRDALIAEYKRLTGEIAATDPQDEPDLFSEMFGKAADEINRRYIAGTIGYIREHHTDLYQKTREAEDKLNEVWQAGLECEANIDEFRIVLKEWYSLQLQGIEIYSEEQGG